MRTKIQSVFHWLASPTNLLLLVFSLVPMAMVLVFMQVYKANFPRADHAWAGMHIAVAMADGQLTLKTLLTPYLGHVPIFNYLQIIVFVWLTDWNVNLEMYVGFGLIIIFYGVMVFLAWRSDSDMWRWTLIPFSVVLFSLQIDRHWVIPFFSQWFYAQVFSIIALAIVVHWFKVRPWQSVGLAAGFSFLATFSNANGYSAWGIVFVALIVLANRRWHFLVVWSVLALAVLLAYIQVADLTVLSVPDESIGAKNAITLPTTDLLIPVQYNFALIGSTVFTGEKYYNMARRVGAVIFLLALLNLLITLQKPRRDAVAAFSVWLPVMLYALFSGTMISLNRAAISAMFINYKSVSAIFWVGFIGLIILNFQRQAKSPTLLRGMLTFVNIVVLAAASVGFVFASYQAHERPLWDSKRLSEFCYRRAFYTQDSYEETPGLVEPECLWASSYLNDLAIRRLALFADAEPISMMPAGFQPGMPIILESDGDWAGYNTQSWLLAGVPPETVLHVFPQLFDELLPSSYSDVSFESPFILNDSDDLFQQVDDFLGDEPETLWYVRREDIPLVLDDYIQTVTDENYTRHTIKHHVEGKVKFLITRYERIPDVLESVLSFDNNIELAIWNDLADVVACETLELQSYWRLNTPTGIPYGYSATFALLNSDNETIDRSDSQLTYEPSHIWEPLQLYLDERSLELPCDLPAGEYRLTIGIYDYQDGRRLIATDDKGDELGDLVTLGSFRVGE